MGKKVLMIDADPQPSLSSYYKILEQAQGGLTEILTDPQNVNSYNPHYFQSNVYVY
jgi:cellulose biosynthesis protein BcsQ